jgi:hypothetical protein
MQIRNWAMWVALAAPVYAQSSGQTVLTPNIHLGFERPEAWGLKYFAATTLLSGLAPPASSENHHVGSIDVGIETDWLPTLDTGQQRIGFNGRQVEDLNKAPVFMRPVVRIGLPANLTAIVATPPPFEVFGVTPRLLAFGLEGPIAQGKGWTVGWRGYGQVGHVRGAFTCPPSVVAFAPGSPENFGRCTGVSDDTADLRYAGAELEFGYKIPGAPKIVPHAAVGGNFIDGVFHVNAPEDRALDHTREWTRGGILSTSGGVTYRVTPKAAVTVDVFYSPLWVERTPTSPRTNDGLFNVRALLSYTFR